MEQWLIGIATGLISGAIVSGAYFWLSGRHLRREAKELFRLNHLILLFLDKAGGRMVYDSNNVAVAIEFTETTQGKSRIQNSQEQSIDGKSRIQSITRQSLGGVARIVSPDADDSNDPNLDNLPDSVSGKKDN